MRNSSCGMVAIRGWRFMPPARLPAWLWSTDGTRILWANPVGAKLFGAANAAALAAKTFGPADPHRRQVAQLAGRLLPTGATRLERLRGFGAALGTLATCACARLDFPDGGAGILVVAMLDAGRTAADRCRATDRADPPESAPVCGAGGRTLSFDCAGATDRSRRGDRASGGRAIARIARACGDRADASAGCRGDGPDDA